MVERDVPLQELVALQEAMERKLAGGYDSGGRAAEPEPWQPVADICEDGRNIILCLELPGLDQSEIEVKIEEQTLIVQGVRQLEERDGLNYHRVERNVGPFRRSFALPANIDQAQVRAQCERGVLQVFLPKSQSSGVRLIEVEARNG